MEWLWWQAAAEVSKNDILPEILQDAEAPSFVDTNIRNPVAQMLIRNPVKFMKEATKLLDTDSEDLPDDLLALFKTGTKTLLPIAGISQAALTIPVSVTQALQNGDFVGAIQALGGWSAGQIDRRGEPEELPDFQGLDFVEPTPEPPEEAEIDGATAAEKLQELEPTLENQQLLELLNSPELNDQQAGN